MQSPEAHGTEQALEWEMEIYRVLPGPATDQHKEERPDAKNSGDTHEKVVGIPNYQGNANQTYKEIPALNTMATTKNN